MPEKTVLFVCVENACRSLMAEAVFNANPPPGWRATSGGTRPADRPHARTVRMLEEIGVGLPNHPPQLATPAMIEHASLRIAMGCLDDSSCPARLKTLEIRDWELPDPASLGDDGFREVRHRIVQAVEGLRTELARRDPGAGPLPGSRAL
jgi:arsenate reductase (thioredoxin)